MTRSHGSTDICIELAQNIRKRNKVRRFVGDSENGRNVGDWNSARTEREVTKRDWVTSGTERMAAQRRACRFTKMKTKWGEDKNTRIQKRTARKKKKTQTKTKQKETELSNQGSSTYQSQIGQMLPTEAFPFLFCKLFTHQSTETKKKILAFRFRRVHEFLWIF